MRILIILITTFLIFGCSDRSKSKKLNNDSLQTNYTDTTQSNIDILNEKTQYIGFIDNFYFSNENEVYIELYFLKENINNDEYNKIVKRTDSLIYKDDENSRHRLPKNLASKYFDLRGLSKLKIYDNKNKFVANADFIRVEYLDQNISPVFIAVYKPEKKIKAGSYYGISNFNETFKTRKYSITNDTILTEILLTKLDEIKPYDKLENNGTHLHFSNCDTILSIINSANFAYIVLSTNNDFKVLYKSSDYENVSEVKIIPLTNNTFPYILTRNIKPETDIMWDNLVYYDGKNYKTKKRQRIE